MVLDVVQINVDSEGQAVLPLAQEARAHLSHGRSAIVASVVKGDPYHLGDGTWVGRPGPKVECSGVLPTRRNAFKALKGTFAAGDAFC